MLKIDMIKKAALEAGADCAELRRSQEWKVPLT